MKSVVAAALVAPAVAGASFGEWTAAQNKVFKTREEFAMRRAIFNNNAALVAAHNAKHAAGEATFTMALNDFADLTSEEFRARYVGGFNGATGAGVLRLECLPNCLADFDQNGGVDGGVQELVRVMQGGHPASQSGRRIGSCPAWGGPARRPGAHQVRPRYSRQGSRWCR